jgi:hypothetical protein
LDPRPPLPMVAATAGSLRRRASRRRLLLMLLLVPPQAPAPVLALALALKG